MAKQINKRLTSQERSTFSAKRDDDDDDEDDDILSEFFFSIQLQSQQAWSQLSRNLENAVLSSTRHHRLPMRFFPSIIVSIFG